MKESPVATAVVLRGLPTDVAQRMKLDPDIVTEAIGNFKCFDEPVDATDILSALAQTLATASKSGALMLPPNPQCTTRADAIVLVSDAAVMIATDFGNNPSVTVRESAALYVLNTMHAQLHHPEVDGALISFADFHATRMAESFTEETDACRTPAQLEELKKRVTTFLSLCSRHGVSPFYFWPSTFRQLAMFKKQGTDRDGKPLDRRVISEFLIVARERHEADHVVIRDDEAFDAMLDESKERIAKFLKLRGEFQDSFTSFLHSRGIAPTSTINYKVRRGAELDFAAFDGNCQVMISPGPMKGSVSITVVPMSALPQSFAALAELLGGMRSGE